MSLLAALKSFYGTTPESSGELRGVEASQSFEIARYAIGLIYDPQTASRFGRSLHELARAGLTNRDSLLAKLYLEVEVTLLQHEPARQLTVESLRRQISQKFQLELATSGLPLLFVEPVKQEIKLGLLFIDQIIAKLSIVVSLSQLREILQPALSGTPLERSGITASGLDTGPVMESLYALPQEQLRLVITDLTRIIAILFEKEVSLEGRQATIKNFEAAYVELKSNYGTFIEGLPQVAMMTPADVLESERLGFMTRETLQQKVLEKTKQLQSEKDSVEQQVKDRTSELNQERAKLNSSIETMPLGLIMISADHKITVSNPAVPKILGYTGKAWDLDDIVHDLGPTMDLLASCDEACHSQLPLGFQDVAFGPKVLRLSLTPVLAEKAAIGTVVLLEDITEAKVLERSRDEFFSIASHELRTPLTAIKGNASMALEFFGKLIDKHKDLSEMIQDIHTSSVRLIEIVNDFLDTSRLEQGKVMYQLENCPLDQIIEQVSYEMGVVLKQKNLYLKVDDVATTLGSLPAVYADPNRTKQILYNLVGNAAKFTESGGITISVVLEAKGFVKVRVTDTGRGIPVDMQKMLFHKFQQAGSSLLTRDTTRGTGLGLYISKLLAEGMSGSVGLEQSVTGEGTTFFFTLPVASASDTKAATLPKDSLSPAKPQITAGNAKPGRILIFEDDPYVQRLYRRLFEREKYVVQLQGSGADSVAKASEFKPDLVLLDVMMPGTNGIEVLRQLKSHPATKAAPVLMVTNLGEPETINEAKALGASAYLIKADFTPEEMLSEVKKYLLTSRR